MYGKILEGVFGHPIMEEQLEVRYLLHCMAVLADDQGVLDVTEDAIARRVNLPIATIEGALAKLLELGYLTPLHPSRTSGWRLVARGARDLRGFVYLMRRKAAHLFKIGLSRDPEARRRQVQADLGCQVELLVRVPTSDMRALERRLHNHFQAASVGGEWFALPPRAVGEFQTLARALDGAAVSS